MLGLRVFGRVVASRTSDLRVVDPAFQLIDDYFVLFEVGVVVALVADAVVFVWGKIRAQFIDFLEGQFLGDSHLALLLAPLLIVQLYYAQILELQLLLLAATARLFLLLAVLLVVGVEVVLFVFGKRIPLACVVDIEVA